MNKNEIIQEYRQLADIINAPLILSAGAALVVLGLREEAGDIDVDIHRSAWDVLFTPEQRDAAPRGPIPFLGMDFHPLPAEFPVVFHEESRTWMYPVSALVIQKQILMSRSDRLPGKAEQDRKDLNALMHYRKDRYVLGVVR